MVVTGWSGMSDDVAGDSTSGSVASGVVVATALLGVKVPRVGIGVVVGLGGADAHAETHATATTATTLTITERAKAKR